MRHSASMSYLKLGQIQQWTLAGTAIVFNWKHLPLYWSFVRRIHQSSVDSPHKGQWRGALMFSLICTWTIGWANNWVAGDLRGHCTHYDVTLMDTPRHTQKYRQTHTHTYICIYIAMPLLHGTCTNTTLNLQKHPIARPWGCQGLTLRRARMPGAFRSCPRAHKLLWLLACLGKWFFSLGMYFFPSSIYKLYKALTDIGWACNNFYRACKFSESCARWAYKPDA